MLIETKKMFLAVVLLSSLTCFQRADYNLPLFAFAYFLWDLPESNCQKVRLFYLFLGTWLTDFVWLVHWGVSWGSDQHQQNGPSSASMFVLAISIIQFLVKMGIILTIYISEQQIMEAVKNFNTDCKQIIEKKTLHPQSVV